MKKITNPLMMSNRKQNKLNNKIKIIQHSRYFNPKWYRTTYNLKETKKHLLARHYLEQGWLKGYNPSLKFCTNDYLLHYRDVARAGLNPLVHYELSGKREGRSAFQAVPPIITPRRNFCFWPLSSISRWIAELRFRHVILKQQNCSVLVYVHCPDESCWDLVKHYLENLRCYQHHVVIAGYSKKILSKAQTWCERNKVKSGIREIDASADEFHQFYDSLREIEIGDFKIVMRVTMKKHMDKPEMKYSSLYVGNEWNQMCIEGVLGYANIHKIIGRLSGDNNIGAIGANELLLGDSEKIRSKVHLVSKRHRIPILNNYLYIAGASFAIRANLLHDYFSSLRFPLLPEEIDAVERIQTANVEMKGYQLEGLPTHHPKRYTERIYQNFDS